MGDLKLSKGLNGRVHAGWVGIVGIHKHLVASVFLDPLGAVIARHIIRYPTSDRLLGELEIVTYADGCCCIHGIVPTYKVGWDFLFTPSELDKGDTFP